MMTFEYAQEVVASNANLLDFAKCLLVGSAPNPLNARAKLCGCVVFLRHPTSWLRPKCKKRKAPEPVRCVNQRLTQGPSYRS